MIAKFCCEALSRGGKKCWAALSAILRSFQETLEATTQYAEQFATITLLTAQFVTPPVEV
jgi:hypothetical protein